MKTVLWQGVAFHSLEYFNIQENDDHYVVASKIIGSYRKKIYSIYYQLIINKQWEIEEFLIDSEVNRTKNILTGKKTDINWEINHFDNPSFRGFQYIDISLTPFTNTLPINNLQLKIGDSKEIDIIYIDLINSDITPVRQRYTRTHLYEYLYENIVSDFTARIQVDENGLVLNYPGLFEKIAGN
ncbi:putative glycolipid-binding domain-containing protein [Sphingobacterium sp. ML3W]|uniref:putative glycolipid-binding domain-containing protein n=1 Tax=Sphingobacterium sp. ML3W TaxID=1538644 RepID=UPI002499E837|nr:putative glycolipid-binding domain-containing protein [Sphingobacterium sp. ML3W]WFA82339.1 putative glycolipid-binding domain-containing protein [Sphingobacterium sp. ML3W]